MPGFRGHGGRGGGAAWCARLRLCHGPRAGRVPEVWWLIFVSALGRFEGDLLSASLVMLVVSRSRRVCDGGFLGCRGFVVLGQ